MNNRERWVELLLAAALFAGLAVTIEVTGAPRALLPSAWIGLMLTWAARTHGVGCRRTS
jgi:hypothetical protein